MSEPNLPEFFEKTYSYKELNEIFLAVKMLANQKLQIRGALRTKKLIKVIQEALQPYFDVHNDIVEALGEKTLTGFTVKQDSKNYPEYQKQEEELLAETVTISFTKVPMSTLPATIEPVALVILEDFLEEDLE